MRGWYLRQSSNHTGASKETLMTKLDRSPQSRVLIFLSLQRFHITVRLETAMGLSFTTFQELNHRIWHHPRSQTIPNNAKINHQIFVVKEQWSSKWLINSPLLLHIQHQSTINKSLLRRLSNVKFFPIVAIHSKKHGWGLGPVHVVHWTR